MQIINNILQQGILTWIINDQGKCDFSITINSDQQTEVLDKDKIEIHRKRGLISAAGKKIDEKQEEKNKKQAILFNDIFRLADAIQAPFEELNMIGYYDFNNEAKLIEQNCNENILDILEQIRNDLQDQLKSWKQLLTQLKKDFYIITFVPNNKLHKILEFFQTHDRQAYLECLPIFQYIYYEITEQQIYSQQRLQTGLDQSVQKQLNDLGALMTQVFIKDEQGQQVGLTSEHKIPAEYLIGDQSSKLKKGRVQFIYVQDDTQLCQSILALYSYTKFYPNASEVLFCNSEKKQLELENFILRAMRASFFYKRPKLYVIANFQALEFIVQLKAYQFIMEQQKENSDFQLFVITQCTDIKQVHIVEELRSSTLFKGILKDNACLELLKPFHQRICCVTSQSSGYGKSTYIKDRIDNEIQTKYVRIPIYGVMDRLKLSYYHQLQLKDIPDNNYAIHYDLYPITGESINILMFELIILKCINNESQGILHFPRNINIFIEVAQSLNLYSQTNQRDPQKIFLTYLKRVELEWDPRNIKVALDGKDKYQIVAKYANEIMKNEKSRSYNQKLLFDDTFTNPVNVVQDLIIEYFRRVVKSPNFYLLNSFIAFVTDQLKLLQQSSFFMKESLEDTFEKLGQPFFKTVVDSLMEFSLKLSKNEASLEKQRTNMYNQSEEEEMVNRFKDSNWNNNNTLLITINQTGSVCPIYKFVNDLPKMLRDLHRHFPNAMPEFKDFLYMDQLDFYNKIFELIITSENQNANPLIFKEEQPFNASKSQKESYNQRKQEFFKQQIKELNLDKIVFTRDNFLKLVLIYIRLRANLPVIVMGETGVGKTAIISYLAERLKANFKHFNIHAGITEKQIIEYTDESKKEAMNDINEIFEGIDLTEDEKIRFIEFPDKMTKELKIQIADQHYREAKQLTIGEESKDELQEGHKIYYTDRKISNLKMTIIFYDEINTNECISGLLKEIVIDKYLQGKKLPPNLRVIAACNPYKLKTVSQHTISSGYNKPYQDNQKVSRLVYTVHPLPESMMSFIWDFGSLSKEEEESYITKLIEKQNIDQSDQGFTKDEINYISECVCKSQEYIRNQEFAWSVSLRDAARFSKLLSYFYQPGKENRHESSLNKEKKKALALSLAFCYMYRITSTDGRKSYKNMIENISTIKASYIKFGPFEIGDFISQEQSKYLNYMEIPQGIGKNTPLKENVFVMITCILNKIPLIITGKPGSSKTLAMNLVTKSMKGSQSSNDFFGRMPAVLQFTYQGSVQSTSRGIERIFEKAIKCQVGFKNNDNVLALVIIDEIGLAEISPYNPLKVLHSLLEPPQVPFVAVSNWNLDASKMNRAITLCRPDPEKNDLIESIESISQEININDNSKHLTFKNHFQESLVQTYLEYLQYQEKECKEGQNFHGLRDFYALTQYVASNIAANQKISYNKEYIVFQGLLRNFGGKSFEKIFEIAENKNLLEPQTNRKLREVSTIDLIKGNIEDRNVRHMMVITDNQQTAIQYVEDICNSKQKEYQIYSGSDFQEDKTEQAAYKLIYDIILRMEKGTIVILQNLESIYQSFYDMLNQNYQIIGSQRFCKVAIGADSTRCNVNENFKCILVCNETQVQKMDAPLLNRFEKQRLLEAQTLDDVDNQRIKKLQEWIIHISQPPNTDFNRSFMFPTLKFSDLNYLVSQTKSIFEQTNNDDYCKQIIIQLANYSGIIRSQLIDNEQLLEIYDQDGIHSKFEELLIQIQTRTDQYNNKYYQKLSQSFETKIISEDEECKQNNDNDPEMSLADSQMIKPQKSQDQILKIIDDITTEYKCNNQANRFSFFDIKEKGLFTGFNIIVHTYQLYLGDLKLNDQHEQLVLSNINSRKMFEETIHDFFFKSPLSILIIISDSQVDSTDRIILCRNIINEQRMGYQKEFKGMKSVVIVIRQNERHQLQFNFAQGWRQIFIDVLNGFGDTKTLECKKLLSYSLYQIFNDQGMLHELVQMSCNAAVSQLQYNQSEEKLQSQLKLIRRLACDDEQTLDLIRDLILFNINTKEELLIDPSQNWQLELVCLNRVLMQKTYSFQIAAIMFLTEVVQKNLAFIFFHMQNSGLLQTLDEDIKSFGIQYFRRIYKDDYYKTPLQDKYIVTDISKLQRYPYCQQIHDKIMEQNPLIDAELIEKRNQLRNEVDTAVELFKEKPFFIREDKALKESIQNLTQKCQMIFDNTFMSEYNIIYLNPSRYVRNFSYLIAANQNEIYHMFIADILQIITPSYESLIELYTIHNKYEDFINKTYSMIQNINFDYSEFMSLLKSIIDDERQVQTEIKYLSRSIIVKCLGKALFKLYFPTQDNVERLPNWADKAKSVYEIYEMMAEVYIQEEINLESKIISFLIDFNHKVLKPLDYSEEQLIEIASTLQNDFKINDVIDDLIIQKERQIELCEDQDTKRKVKNQYSRFIYDTIYSYFKNWMQVEYQNEFLILTLEILEQDFTNYKNNNDDNLIEHLMKVVKIIAEILDLDENSQEVLQDFEGDFNQDNKSELISIIQQFIENLKIDSEHPLMVALCDAFQAHNYQIDYEGEFDFETEGETLNQAMDRIVQTNLTLLDRLRSVALFKSHVYEMTTQIINSKLYYQPITCKEIIDSMNAEFVQQQETHLPLLTFVVKQLQNQLSLDQIIYGVQSLLPSIKYLQIPDQKYKEYPITFDKELKQRTKQLLLQQISQDHEEILHHNSPQPLLTLTEYLYLNDKNGKLEYLDLIVNSRLSSNQKEFFKSVLQFNQNSEINEFYALSQNPIIRKFQTIWSYIQIVASTQPDTSFLRAVLENPNCLDNNFIPFQVNVPEDPEYFKFIFIQDFGTYAANQSQVARYYCKQCGKKFCIPDCGEINHSRKLKFKNKETGQVEIRELSSGQCGKCGANIGFGAKDNSIFIDQQYSKDFNTESESEKGYIFIASEDLEGMNIRSLSEVNSRLGGLIINSLIICSIIYGDNKQQEQSTRFVENLCRKFNILNQQIGQLRPFEAASTIYQHSQVKYWNRLKGIIGLNDDNLTTIILQIIKQLTTIENSNAFNIQNLITIEGRRKFEEDFVKLCIPNDKSMYQEFFKSLNDDEEKVNLILKKLNDEVDIQAESEQAKNENLYSQFRATIPMSEQQVLDYIKKPDTSKFISISLQYIDSLSKIQHLLPLIEWVSYSLSRWNNKLLESTLGDQTIETFLKAQGQNKKKDKAMFIKLFDATKAIKDLFQVDGCDQINFLEYNKYTQVKYALMVKQRKDSLGYILYCMIQTLCTYQNTFLEEISTIPQYSWLKEKKNQKVKFMELTKDQLINSKVGRQEILDIVQDKSYAELKYGFGKENRFIEDEITSQLEEEFIKRKVFIEFDNTVEFQFANISSLFNQYDEIQSKIPQEKYNEVTLILQQLRDDEQISGFFQDLITAINFLSQTGGSSETTLYNYLSAFQINSYIEKIGHEPTLKYILHLFEEVEALQIPILIEQTHPKYQTEIQGGKLELLYQILNEIKEETPLVQLKTLIGRLTIRHLSFTQQQSNAKQSIVEYLLLETSDYLYGIQEDKIPLKDFLENKLLKANLKLKHAYYLYKNIERRIKSIQEEFLRQQNEEIIRQNLNQQQLEADQRVKDELQDRQSMLKFQSLDEMSRNQYPGRNYRQFGQEDTTTFKPASVPKKKKQALVKGRQTGPEK